MKKLKLFILTLLLILPFSVLAISYPKVLTLTAEVDGNKINYSGTIENGSHAVMCKLYNSQDEEIDKLSVAVNNFEFEGMFTTTTTGNYKVACANYEGGEIKTTNVSIEEEPTYYTVTFNLKGASPIEPVEVLEGQKVSKPTPDPTNGDKVFGGWFEDDTFTREFDFNTPITSNVTLYAKWIDNEESDNFETEKYTITDSSGNVISFTEEKDREFTLNIIDYLTFSLEDLENAEIPKDMFDSMMEMIANATKNYGTLLSFYEIEVRNDDGYLIHEGPFNIKIKMTDEMKKYNTFKIIYVDADNNFATESPITLTMDGDYLVGTLDHLSTYALTGSNTSTSNNTNTTNNPQTGDNIYIWFGMLIISILGLSLGTFTATKFKKSKNR